MKLNKILNNKICVVLYTFIFIIFESLLVIGLRKTSSCLDVYIFVFILGIICFIANNYLNDKFINSKTTNFLKYFLQISNVKMNKSVNILIVIFAILFTSFVILANRELLYENIPSVIWRFINSIIIPIAIFIIWVEILKFLYKFTSTFKIKKPIANINSKLLFFVCWSSIACVYILILSLVYYPGIINPDANIQIKQILCNNYVNHYSFFITMIMKLFFDIGTGLFSNASIGIFLFVVFQIIVLSGSFALILKTMYEIGVPKLIIAIICIWFSIMPFHTVLAVSMYTDTLFTASCIVFTITTYKILINNDLSKINLVLFVLCSLCMSLFRPNGYYVLVISAIAFLILFYNRKALRKLKVLLIASCIISTLALNPLLQILNVEKTDIINHLSVPTMQICRVLKDDRNLTEEQIKLIDNIANHNKLRELYDKKWFDNIKDHIRINDNQNILIDHLFDYINLYIQLWISYPDEYLYAWSDLMNNYFNPKSNGLNTLEDSTFNNELIINKFNLKIASEIYSSLFLYINKYLNIFQTMGFYTWAIVLAFFIALTKKDKNTIYIFLPILFVLLSVLLSSPNGGEIRYIYPVVCATPFFWTIVLQNKKETNT